MLNIVFFIITLASMLILFYLDVSFIISLLITFIIIMVVNNIINRLHRKVLDSDCDPERYLKMLDKQYKRSNSKPRIVNYLAVNRAVGHMVLGNFQTAKEYLEGIDTSYLSKKNGSLLAYTINLILCHYELGETEKAEILYENNLIRLCLCPLGKRLKKSVEILIGERYYYLKKYDLSYNHLKNLLDYDLSKRQYLGVLYRLAQMDVINGAKEQAIEKFKKIAKLGNKLGIAKESQKMLESMENI